MRPELPTAIPVDNTAPVQPARYLFISWGKTVQTSGATSEHRKKRRFFSQQVQNKSLISDQESKIVKDGLRYKHKESGSPFKNPCSIATSRCCR
jgi:hypothetical protein